MKRREFIAGLGSALAWPLSAWAQQGERMRRIGVLMALDETDPQQNRRLAAFTQALAGLGWTDGRNVRMDFRWAGGDINRIRALAQELVGLQPDIIVASGTLPTIALQRETRTIPIVFVSVAEPVVSGVVAALNQPGGNITGFAIYEASLGGKWLELLSKIAPALKRATIMFNPETSAAIISETYMLRSLETAARSLKMCQSLPRFIATQRSKRPSSPWGASREAALSSCREAFALGHRTPIISAAARNNVPAVYGALDFARDGGLLSYAPDFLDHWRRAAAYVDRILRGAKPADLPVQLPTKFEMVINLKTAKALGLTIPPNLLAIADQVIE